MAKKILVPGAGVGQAVVLEKAKKMGLTTVVVSPKGDYPGFKFADIVYHHDVRDKEKVLEIAILEKIDGIVSDQNDIPVETIGYVSEKLSLDGISYQTSKVYCRKDMMRAKCVEIGVPSLPYGIATNLNDALQIAEEIGYPIMCKPSDSQGSIGVYKVHSKDEFKKVFIGALSNSLSGRIIVEQWIEGKEFSIDGLAIKGKYKALLTLENTNFNLDDRFIAKRKVFPTSLNEEELKELLSIDEKVNTFFGLVNGRSHNEYILNPSDNKFYLIDASARGGGTFISSHLLPFSCGFDSIELLLKIALGEDMSIEEYSAGTKAVCYICFYLEPGEIKSIENIEKIKKMDCILGFHVKHLEVGQTAPFMTDKTKRLGPILIGCDTKEELECAVIKIKNSLVISTEKNTNSVIWE